MDDILLEQILNESKEVVALYGGGFKPPTAGHFLVVKKALEDNSDIDVFKVLVGGGSRDGIEQHEAVLAWEMFSKYLPMKVEVIPAKNPPIKEIYNFAKENPEKTIYFVIGGREGREDDVKDIAQRTKGMAKYQNVIVKAITTPDGGMSGTNARLALKKGNEEEFFKFLPSELSDEEKNEIFQMMIPNVSEELNEGMLDKYLTSLKSKFKDFIKGLKQEGKETKEAFKKIVNAVRSGEKLSKEEKTDIGDQLKDVLKLTGFTAASVLPGGVIYLLLTRVPALKTTLTPSSFLNEDIIEKTDYILPRGKKVILQAEDEDYNRGLIVELLDNGGYEMAYWYDKPDKPYPVEILVDGESIKPDGKVVEMKFHPQDYYDEQDELNEGRKKKKDPKKGTGKKPKGSSRRLYTDEDPKDTVGIKFRTKEDIVDTLNKKSFKAKSHARQSQIINLIHQRVRAAYGKAKDPETKARLKRGLDYIEKRKEASKKKTQRLKKQKNENVAPNHDGKAAPFGSGYKPLNEDDTEFKSYSSTFAPQITIMVVFDSYDGYDKLESLFKEYGYGFYAPESKTIIINGEEFVNSDLNFNDLKFVEAHEISHLILNHSGPRSDKDELEADLGAYLLLKSKNMSTDRLIDQFKFRHGMEFSEELLDGVKSKFSSLMEGDTYEKMAAKGKKSGNLKQGTVRKRLNIPKGKKIPLSKINKEISRLKKMDKDKDKKGVQLGDKNQKYYKALQLSKTLKTTTNVNENATYSNHIDYKQEIRDLTKHMLKKGMNIQPLPQVVFKHDDKENAQNFLGRTAYYDPNNMVIVLYTEGRHPKDIARSYAHEMIHHIQNLEGRLENINTTNTTEDDYLNDIEREAYTKGNMIFRNYTDGKDGVESSSLDEKKKPYKHKYGFDDKLGKDPFGLNAYARELAQGLEEEVKKTLIPEKEVVPSKEKVMNYKIYSDMDGVLVDFDKRFMEFSDGIPPREYEKKYGKEGFWDLVDNKTGVRFWRGMDYMPDGETYWNYISKYSPIFLSSPSRSETSRIGKRMWVKDNHPDTKLVLAQAYNKKNYADENSILIDDRESNIEQWKAAGGIGILHKSASDTIKQLKALGL